MGWVKLINQDELPAGARLLRSVGELEVLLVNHQGRIYAMESRCPHMRGHLVNGTLTDDGHIICPVHHSEFSLENGEIKHWAPWPPVVGPALGAIRTQRPLRVFPLRVEEGSIWIGEEVDDA